MWRERSVFAFATLVNSLAFVGILPFKWDSQIRQFRLNTYKPQIILVYCRVGLTWLYAFYLCVRTLQFTVFDHIEPDKLKLLCFWTVTYIMVTLVTINTVVHSSELVRAMNQFYALNKRFSNNPQVTFDLQNDATVLSLAGLKATIAFLYLPLDAQRLKDQQVESKVNKRINGYFTAFFISGVVNSVLMAFVHAEHPLEIYYMSSLLDEKIANHPMVKVAFIMHEFIQTVTSWGFCLFYVVYTISYMTVMAAWLAKLRRQCLTSVGKYSQYIRFLQFYIMNQSMIESVYPWMLPGQKYVLVPTSIAGCYVTLYSTDMMFEKPKQYGFFSLVTISVLVFELTYFWLCMELHLQGRSVQSYFLRFNWRNHKPYPSKHLYHGLPKHAGIMKPFKEWRPSVFLGKVAKATVKIRLYTLH